MKETQPKSDVEKLQTGIPGFDFIAQGGLPRGRTSLVAGSSGSAKTIFAVHFLAAGITEFDQPGVFVTFEESKDDIQRNVRGLGWDLAKWEDENRLSFIDVSPRPGEEWAVAGDYDFGGLLSRIEKEIRRIGATRVSLDSIGGIFSQFPEQARVRAEILRIAKTLNGLGVTTVMTGERGAEYGPVSRHGVEEYAVDNVIILRNVLEQDVCRRTMQVLKFRGARHHKGEFPFTIRPGQGTVVIPLAEIQLKQRSSNVRIHSGNDELDVMCGGGFYRDSIVLCSGATGTGKTLMTTEFVLGGVKNGERCILFAFEESRDQLFRNALGWGMDFEAAEKKGLLRVVCNYPEATSLEEVLIDMKEQIDEFKPKRVAVDSLSALERVSTPKGFREFVIGLTSFIKERETAGLFTATTSTLTGAESASEKHISTITDSIVLLRYVEMFGEMHRGIMVLKMRGSPHDKRIREFTIDGQGRHIREAFRNVSGVLSGSPTRIEPQEFDRFTSAFDEARE